MNAIGIHDREIRIDSEKKKCLLEFCSKVSDICGFKMSAKEVLWNYACDILLNRFTSRRKVFCRLNYYIKLIFGISKYKKFKKNSMRKSAFLGTNK